MRITKKRVRVVVPILAATALGLMLGSRCLRVDLCNATSEAMTDVTLRYPGGRIAVERLGPGATRTWTVRRPLAGFWSDAGDVPLTLDFRTAEGPAATFRVRCELGLAGPRPVDLSVGDEWEGTRHRVVVTATMDEHQFLGDHLVSNAMNPKIGPRRFMTTRRESIGRVVIDRPEWSRATWAWLGGIARDLVANRRRPIASVREIIDDRAWQARQGERPASPPCPNRLPFRFRDFDVVIADTRTHLVQSPSWP